MACCSTGTASERIGVAQPGNVNKSAAKASMCALLEILEPRAMVFSPWVNMANEGRAPLMPDTQNLNSAPMTGPLNETFQTKLSFS